MLVRSYKSDSLICCPLLVLSGEIKCNLHVVCGYIRAVGMAVTHSNDHHLIDGLHAEQAALHKVQTKLKVVMSGRPKK